MMRSALSNSAAFDRCVLWPGWIMKEGLAGIALTLLMASSGVPRAFGLAGLSKPTWLSLICRKVMPEVCAAASPMMPSEVGMPPATVHRTPVPAQVMHSRTLRLLTPSAVSSSCALMVGLLEAKGSDGHDRETRRFIPHVRNIPP